MNFWFLLFAAVSVSVFAWLGLHAGSGVSRRYAMSVWVMVGTIEVMLGIMMLAALQLIAATPALLMVTGAIGFAGGITSYYFQQTAK